MTERVIILGATSDIAQATAIELAKLGTHVVLAARDMEQCERIAKDLRTRHDVTVTCMHFDALDFESHDTIYERAEEAAGGQLTGVLVAHGLLGKQTEAALDFTKARAIIDVNYTSFVSTLNAAAEHFESRKGSFICAIGSVAGDRGRQSNFIYGSTKAAVDCYLSGLRNKMFPLGVAVITIKPGFIDTKMTRDLGRSKLVVGPEVAARDIVKAIRKRKSIVYTPFRWRIIMFVIRAIPEFMFKRMKL